MSEPFLGEICMVGFNFAPRGWATCDGQLLSISQNAALFSLLGTFYGGDGRSTFALPDLRGATPMHWGQGPGLSNYSFGQRGGAETVTLASIQDASHRHEMSASGGAPASPDPLLRVLGLGNPMYMPSANTTLAPAVIKASGGNLPHNHRQPFLTLRFVICLMGFFPQRP
jgi:microcystin-dependent protein